MTRTTSPARPRRSLSPVRGVCRWAVQPGTAPCPHPGVLVIEVRRPSDPERTVTEAYTVRPIVVEGKVAGYALRKPGGAEYHVDAGDPAHWHCDCPDGTFNEGRLGGCKHAKSLRAALAALECGRRAKSENPS